MTFPALLLLFSAAGDFRWNASLSVVSRLFVYRSIGFVPIFESRRRTADAGAIPPYDWLLLNVHLKPLQQDSRLGEVAARAKAQFDGMLQILDESRERGEMPDYLDKPLADLRHRLGA